MNPDTNKKLDDQIERTLVLSTHKIEKGSGRPDNRQGYRLASGEKVPSVTTVLGRFKESGGLIRWAYKRGCEGVELYEETATSIGTVAHDAIEHSIHGGDGFKYIEGTNVEDNIKQSATKAFNAYLKWAESCNVSYVATEVSLCSEKYGFGGAVDCIADIHGVRAVLDWKTSKDVYTDYLIQVAAYAILWEECRGEPIKEGYLCRFSKTTSGFQYYYWPEEPMELAKQQFLRLVECYKADKRLGEML